MSSLMKYTKNLRRFFSIMTVLMMVLTVISVSVLAVGLCLRFIPSMAEEKGLGEIAAKAIVKGLGGIILFLLWGGISVYARKFFSEMETTVCPFTPKTGDILHRMSAVFFALSFVPQNITALTSWIISRTAYSVWPIKPGYLALTVLCLFLEKVFCYGAKLESLRYYDHEEWFKEKTN